ncbi:hypothetical protein RRG08_041764 [Elysia crispata]|uniref:Uncharacterized protein n=1 Tax=Elysia crispata TaxID=231223 RepID=A0AAE1D751_9GAST|nr:hypothetical protein RRG08_041764 [Elysia crispata]
MILITLTVMYNLGDDSYEKLMEAKSPSITLTWFFYFHFIPRRTTSSKRPVGPDSLGIPCRDECAGASDGSV